MAYLDADWIRWVLNWDTGHWEPWHGDESVTPEINEMEMIGSTSEVAVIVQVDWFYSSKGVKRYFITKDNDPYSITSPVIKNLAEVNMGSPDTLTNFINWTITSFPAEHYALVMWDHGSGFKGLCEDANGVSGTPTNPPPTDSLTMVELKSALSNAMAETGVKINLIGFVACLMQMTEVAYQIRDYGNVLVASEEVMRADIGWPFDYILANLTESSDMDEVEFSEAIVYDYCRIVQESEPGSVPPTISSLDLTRMESFATKLDDFAYSLIINLNSSRDIIEDCRDRAQEFYLSSYIDLYNFTENTLETDIPEIMNAANALLYEIDQVVLYEWHSAGTDAHGISIYFPKYQSRYENTTYATLDISILHLWDDFLMAYLDI